MKPKRSFEDIVKILKESTMEIKVIEPIEATMGITAREPENEES